MNALRKRLGKRNGVVWGGLLDIPEMERKIAKADQQRRRAKKVAADAE